MVNDPTGSCDHRIQQAGRGDAGRRVFGYAALAMTRFHYASLLLACALGAAACGGDDDAPPDANLTPDARPPRGTFSLSWTITQGGAAATCADVNGSQVVISFIAQGAGSGDNAVINCSAGEGTSQQINVGTYDLDIDLVDSSIQSVLDAPVMVNGVEITENNDTPLDPIVFEVP